MLSPENLPMLVSTSIFPTSVSTPSIAPVFFISASACSTASDRIAWACLFSASVDFFLPSVPLSVVSLLFWHVVAAFATALSHARRAVALRLSSTVFCLSALFSASMFAALLLFAMVLYLS